MNGIVGIKPEIKKVKLERSMLRVDLEDGRVIMVPKKLFPFLKKAAGKIFIADGDTIIFDKANEVIHIEEILGRYEDYRYAG
jgi:RNase P/RNase MRP subunit p29